MEIGSEDTDGKYSACATFRVVNSVSPTLVSRLEESCFPEFPSPWVSSLGSANESHLWEIRRKRPGIDYIISPGQWWTDVSLKKHSKQLSGKSLRTTDFILKAEPAGGSISVLEMHSHFPIKGPWGELISDSFPISALSMLSVATKVD